MGKQQQVIFINTGWHRTYDGTNGHEFFTSAKWQGKEKGHISDIENFKEHEGMYYGYASPPKATINVSNFDDNAKECCQKILVIFVAPDPRPNQKQKIIGWYRNAKVFRRIQKRPPSLSGYYYFSSKVSDSLLVPPDNRFFTVNKIFRTIWYAKKPEDESFIKEVLKYIDNYAIDSSNQTISNESFFTTKKRLEAHANKLSEKKLIQKIVQSTHSPVRQNVITQQYSRNQFVTIFVKRQANGLCELCHNPGPFPDSSGSNFLETHHIIWLSKKGEDTVQNTVALCPNCHRKMHHVKSKKDVKVLKKIGVNHATYLSEHAIN